MERLIFPVVVPVGVIAVTVLLIVGIGTLLLTVGEFWAVPVALALALLILAFASFLASRPGGIRNP